MSLDQWSFVSRTGQESVDFKAAAVEVCQWLLACLRAQYWNYQESHWRAQGSNYYGSHLLFQRLYESVEDQTDMLAEKMVGIYDSEAVDGMDLGAKFEAWIRRWNEVDCFHKRGLLSEQDFQATCKKVYEFLKGSGELTLGMDDFLMSAASEHETNQYLLRQAVQARESAKQAAKEWAALSNKG